MKKKSKYLNLLRLKKLTREPSLKILITDKEISKKRNVSIDFSSTPIRPQKKIIKRNLRENSFNNLIFDQTEEITKSGISNLSYMPSRKLILKKNISIQNNNLFSKKYYNYSSNNKSFNFNLKKSNKMININQMKTSFIKKNSKNYKITTQAYLPGAGVQNNYKTVGSFNNNFINYNASSSSSTSKKLLNSKIKKINSNEKNLIKKTKNIINKKKMSTNKNIIKNDNKYLNSNFKLSDDSDFLNIVKMPKTKYRINKGISPPLKERHHSLTLSKKDLSKINEGKIKLIRENVKLKKKNEELLSKINFISKEFNEIKKDNNDIKEELKEKNNILKKIKLTMDIFNQELIRLQNKMTEYNTNNNNTNNNNNNNYNVNKSDNKIKRIELTKKINLKGTELSSNNEKTPSTGIGNAYEKKNLSNEVKIENISQNNQTYSLIDENNISLAENLNINEEEYKKVLEKCANNNQIRLNNNSHTLKNLNLVNQQQQNETFSDFNQEFLKNVNNFSKSWRKAVEQMMHRKGFNKDDIDIEKDSNG